MSCIWHEVISWFQKQAGYNHFPTSDSRLYSNFTQWHLFFATSRLRRRVDIKRPTTVTVDIWRLCPCLFEIFTNSMVFRRGSPCEPPNILKRILVINFSSSINDMNFLYLSTGYVGLLSARMTPPTVDFKYVLFRTDFSTKAAGKHYNVKL